MNYPIVDVESLRRNVEELRAIRDREKAQLEKDEEGLRQIHEMNNGIHAETVRLRKDVHERMQQVLVLSNQQQTTDAMIQACAAIGAELDKPDEYMKEHDRIIDECKKKLSDTLKLFDDGAFDEDIEKLEKEKLGLERQLAERKKEHQDLLDQKEAEKEKQMRIRNEYFEKAMAKEKEIHEVQMKLAKMKFMGAKPKKK